MSDSKEIVRQKFIEHFLFDYTDKDEYEVRMLSEIFENIYYAKGLSFKPKGEHWQVFRCLQNQQDIINDLRSQLNNMEICYIQMKKERDELHSATDKALTHVKRQTECFRDLKTDATDMQTKNWWQAKVQILNPIRRMLEAALRGASD